MERPATTRLHVGADLGGGGPVTLGRDQAHYLRAVLRLEAGAQVLLFNGRHGEWLAAVAGLTKGAATLELMGQVRPQAEATGPALLFAPIKKGPLDFLVQKAVELGVSSLHPSSLSAPTFLGSTWTGFGRMPRRRRNSAAA